MSERPEVKITAEKLCKAICGKTIDKVYSKTTIGNEFANKIRESDVRCVETYGRNMVITFSTGIYLRNHMLMWGKWRIYDRQEFEEGKSNAPRRTKLKWMIRTTTGEHSTADEPVTKKIEYGNNSGKENVIDVRNDSRVRLMIFTKDKVAVQFNGPILKIFFCKSSKSRTNALCSGLAYISFVYLSFSYMFSIKLTLCCD
jgi:endonuclease VIII